jgi:FkbM family methyltransferase
MLTGFLRHWLLTRQQTRFYRTIIKPEDTVFDVGANVGQRSGIFARLCRKVVAFEPQPSCLKQLRSNFKNTSRVIIEDVGLSDSAGELVMYECDADVLSSCAPTHIEQMKQERFKSRVWERTRNIRVVTLDAMIEKYGHPTFIKIDVEGYELNVLQGLSVPIERLSFEYASETINTARQCVEQLMKLSDYRFNYCVGEDLNYVLPEHVNAQDFIERVIPEMSSTHLLWGDIYAID